MKRQNKRKEKRAKDENIKPGFRPEVVLTFPKGQQSERNVSSRENHPSGKGETPWGDFHASSRFARSTIPEKKFGLRAELFNNTD